MIRVASPMQRTGKQLSVQVAATSPQGAREHPRVDAVFRIQYSTVDQLVVAYSNDLSKGGVFVCTNRAFLPMNAVGGLLLQLPEAGGGVPGICPARERGSAGQRRAAAQPAGAR